MARAALSTESSKVYVGMLIFTCLAMVLGIGLMVLEGGEYDWVRKPQATADVKLPPPPKADVSAAVKTPIKVAEAPKPIDPPAAVPAPLPPVNSPPAVAEAPKPVEGVPPAAGPPLTAPAGTGPMPSPLAPPPPEARPIPSPLAPPATAPTPAPLAPPGAGPIPSPLTIPPR